MSSTDRGALSPREQPLPEIGWLTAVLDLMPVGLVLLEPGTARVVFANRAADRLTGGSFAPALGAGELESAGVVTDREGRPLRDAEHPAVRAARGEELDRLEVGWQTPAGRRSVVVSSHTVPAIFGHPGTVVVSIEDVSEMRVREDRAARLYEDAQAAQGRSIQALALLDALFGNAPVGLALLDRELRYERVNDALAAMDGVSARDHLGRTMDEILPDVAAGLTERFAGVIETRRPIVDLEYSGETPASPGETRHWRGTFYPVIGEQGEVVGLGALVLDTTERKLAEQETERALAAERAERERAERAERRASFLAEAQATLGESLDYEETLQRLARIVVPALADWCTIDMVEPDSRVTRVAVAAVDPAQEKAGWDVARRWPLTPEGPGVIARVLRTGVPELDAFDRGDVEASARSEEHAELLKELGPVSSITVPLRIRGRVLGAVMLVNAQSGVVYDEDDVELARELAARAAVAVDNARLYSSRSAIARTLQESLLPPHLPSIRGLELAARYRAAGEGIDVGGDFYDVFAVGEDAWALVIGDVCGKGADAAALTALMRYTVRAAAVEHDAPASVLQIVNDGILRQRSDGRFSTAIVARVEVHDGGATLCLASGGHPLPLLLRGDGSVEPIGAPGTLLGVLPEVNHVDVEARLGPGDALVLFTDGLSEAGAPDRVMSPEGLAELIASCRGLAADEIARRVEEHAASLQTGPARDDLALLVARVPAGPSESS